MSKKKNEQTAPSAQASDFGHEIWGLVFLSLGILVLISLISYFINDQTNILGYYFGTCLSSGLIWFFGPIAAFTFPAAVIYLGWVRLRAETFSMRILFFSCLLIIEVCFLFSVRHLPLLAADPSFSVQSNNIGLFFVSLIKPVFGKYQFGPYFLGSLAFVVTILSFLRIPPQRVFSWIKIAFLWIVKELKPALLRFLEMFKPKEGEAVKEKPKKKIKEKQETSEAKIPVDTKTKVEKVSEISEKISPDENPDNFLDAELQETKEIVLSLQETEPDAEEEAKQRLELELAAFRAKKHEPIKIMTIETPEMAEPEEAEEGDEDFATETGRIGEERAKQAFSQSSALPLKPYEIPDASVLPDPPALSAMVDKDGIEKNSAVLEKTLMNFGVEGKVVFVSPGPVVTRYEIELAPGIKVSKVVSLHDDISMAVGGQRIRIEAPIPGKSAVGIELPNGERQIVHFKHILTSDAFRKSKAKLPVVIGTNISGAPYVTDITKMPHVLIAGQTGSGKSVAINSVICSMLMTMKPEELRLIMIDPKKVELAFYEGIPHLYSPVVTESKEAVKALQWGVLEMERRYRMLAKVGARNIDSFNTRVESGKIGDILTPEDNKALPFIVIIVDELADLMMTASKDVEGLIQRIAQLARAVGIHLIVATQRPSVDIITGPIKANLTSRIAFRTIQSTDSRTILGHVGAEKLLGMGDMLFLRNGAPEIERFHGAFISEEDVEKIVAEVRKQKVDIERIESFMDEMDRGPDSDEGMMSDGDRDELFDEAAQIITSIGQGSTSLLQRRMKIGYARAGRLMDELERAGIVGPPDGSKAREVLVKPDELDELLARLR
jgi:S-DNA-T family DNA segregation ATPase FtsK/SpoIIIE